MKEMMDFYKGKKVLVTGHTGFKGTWMCHVLLQAGADVIGYALEPPTNPSLFALSNLKEKITSVMGDIRDLEHLKEVFNFYQPEIVIHMAAQPIVRDSYKEPVYTYEANVMGTVNVCECVRLNPCVKSFLNVTTDKVYENKEWEWGYRENEPLDGFDPYSNSKSCSELVTHSYKNSFFCDMQVAVSTARAGNVIGGGDFANDRIVPDCVRAAMKHEDIIVRNPHSTRPFQHVLEPVLAYLMICWKQYEDRQYEGYYNVGPDEADCVTTERLVNTFCELWGDNQSWVNQYDGGPHEANFLKLDCSKLKTTFGWKPRWDFDTAMEKTVEWSKVYADGGNLTECVDRQIGEFMNGGGGEMDTVRDELEKCLSSEVPDIDGKTIIIWGTGNTAQLSYEGLCRLESEGFEVTAYCDSNSEKWGIGFNGKPVIEPDKLKDYEKVCVLIATPRITSIRAIEEKLQDMGIEYHLLDEIILKKHKPEVLKCYDLLGDKESKRVYAQIIVQHMGGGYETPVYVKKTEDQYFSISEFTMINENEIFIDCGAYVGDTIEQFIWKRDGVFKKIIAFEPDKNSCDAMKARIERLKKEWNLKENAIEVFPYGIADRSENRVFESYDANNGLGSKFVKGEDNGESVGIISLDEYLSEPYTFLKADIESYEYKMLLGARQGIKQWKPLIAVCIYHNAVDLYSIPLLIHSIESGYKMAVRHHSNTLAETVLYCWC